MAKIWVHLREMGLAPLQRQRLIFLLGNRWTGSDKIKIVCKQYNTWHENHVRALEILRELYWEAKRAPDMNTTCIRNPYRREQLRRKLLGRTREERLASIKAFEEFMVSNRAAVDAAEMGLDAEKAKIEEGRRVRRREFAQRRRSLGFNDKGKEEVDDKVLEDMEYNSREYQQQIEEQKERKPVKLVAPVKGISRKEIESLMLHEHEKFKPI